MSVMNKTLQIKRVGIRAVGCRWPLHCLFCHQSTKPKLIFRQLFELRSFTFTYLLADAKTREAIIIDPVLETVGRDLRLLQDLKLTLKYALNTHVHADHVTGTGRLKRALPSCRSAISRTSNAQADILLQEADELRFGNHAIMAHSTPGHTDGCMTFVVHGSEMVFTGDAVLIRGCGRTDFQQGNSGDLYDSVHKKIFSLPDHYRLYPAHDYTGQTMSTVGEEKTLNPRLTRTKGDFIKIMGQLKLPYPSQIDVALPANQVCGLQDEPKR